MKVVGRGNFQTVSTFLGGGNTRWRYLMTKEFHRCGTKLALVLMYNQTVVLEPMQNDPEMLEMFIRVLGEDEDVVHVAGEERKISKDTVH